MTEAQKAQAWDLMEENLIRVIKDTSLDGDVREVVSCALRMMGVCEKEVSGDITDASN